MNQITLVKYVESFFRPLTAALTGPTQEAQLLRRLGFVLPAGISIVGTLKTPIEAIESAVNAFAGGVDSGSDDSSTQDLEKILAAARQLSSNVNDFRSLLSGDVLASPLVADTDFLEVFARRLFDLLIVDFLGRELPATSALLNVVGLIEVTRVFVEGDPNRVSHVSCVVNWERFPKLISNPAQTIKDHYGWGAGLALKRDRLFESMRTLAQLLGMRSEYRPIAVLTRDAFNQALGSAAQIPLGDDAIVLRLPLLPLPDTTIGIDIYPVEITAGQPEGLAFCLFADTNAALVFKLSTHTQLEAQLTSSSSDLGVLVRPDEPLVVLSAVSSPNPVSILEAGAIDASLTLKHEALTGAQLVLLGSDNGTRLQAGLLYVTAALEKPQHSSDMVLRFETAISQATIAIEAGDGDGFLQKILPADGIRINFDFGIGWSNRQGLYFRGSGGIEVTLPVHKDLFGVLKVDSVFLGLRAKEINNQAAIEALAAVTANLKLGPIQGSVERIGVIAGLTFSSGGGNLGSANIALAFKPPDGAGMAINASAIAGGGYLSFNQEKEEYAGLLYLEIKDKIAITAIGLLTTRMPDGRKGFSLLLLITAEFPPITLGYGFVLIGVGGLLGVNRTMVLDALRAGIKNKTLDSILFPKNPVANAPKIISDLQTVFPPAEGRFVFGPMAKIAWGGAYPLLTIELGILIELGLQAGMPASVRLAILGKVTLALPKREKPEDKVIVYINLDILGLVDFDKSDASVDATLFDSRIAEFPITGDMAMRLNWGASPTFVQAAGGFHPRFQPPPNFPTLDRLAISIAKGDNPRIRLESYMALTSNTVQFGARLDIFVAYGSFSGAAFLAFDALVEFPFHFVVDLEGGVVIKWGSKSILTATLYLSLTGPGPLRVVGEATFHFLGFKRLLPIDETFGESEQPEPLPPGQPFVQLRDAFADPQNWSAQLPAEEHMYVSLREVAGSTAVVVHPLGSLTVRQTVVPLDVAISRFANTTPDTTGSFTVEQIKFGEGSIISEDSKELRDNFAPAQFFQMNDEDKLGQPAFQLLPSGRTQIGTTQLKHSEQTVGRVMHYETAVIDKLEERSSRGRGDGIAAYALPETVLEAAAALSAAGQSPLRSTGSATYAGPTDKQVRLSDPTYVVVSAEDLSCDKEAHSKPSEVEARQHLSLKNDGACLVVGEHEVGR